MNGRQAIGAVESITSNPHLNVFAPYSELGRSHEDQLTRAAMIVLRLVPLARETLLHEIGERSLTQLPDCTVDLQASHVVDPSEESASNGKVQRGRLVSVFLTPDFEPPEIDGRGHRHRSRPALRRRPALRSRALVVLIESKACRRWARRNGHRVAEINLPGVRFHRAPHLPPALGTTCWSRGGGWSSWACLHRPSRRSCRTSSPMPTRTSPSCSRSAACAASGKDPTRRKWRLRLLLREATGIQPERVGLVHVRLDVALGATSLQRAALDIDDQKLTLHLWPGELKPQAEQLYSAGRAERLSELDESKGPWRAQGAAAAARLSQRADAHAHLPQLRARPGDLRATLAGRGLVPRRRPPPRHDPHRAMALAA